MQAIRPIQIILLICMLVAAASAHYLKPTIKMADQRNIDLERMLPKQFSDWRLDEKQVVVEPDPVMLATIQRVYSQTVSRTYINSKGQRIMLAVAYGKDQSDGNNNVHLPEVCYPAQGFTIEQRHPAAIGLPTSTLPVMQLLARHQERTEPITYWVMVGESAATTGREQKLAQLRYGLKGVIPDGLLFRVSSIGNDLNENYALQNDFVLALNKNLDQEVRNVFFGVMDVE